MWSWLGPGSRRGSRVARTGLALAAALAATLAGRAPAAAQEATGGEEEASPRHASVTDNLEKLAAEATAAVVLIDVRTPSDTRQGSGFIVEPSGRILTNNHVVRDARSIRVKLASGDIYDYVSVLATDDRRDVAVLQIPGFDLPSLPLGNSDSVRIGAPVVLIGSPLGLENTVSTGIVSGRRQEPEGYQRLQISAPASPGSSGGPVLSRSGDVVAIAVSQMRNGQNLNFALPINYVRGLLTHLVDAEPVAILGPPSERGERRGRPLSTEEGGVNDGLRFELDGFGGYALELEGRVGEERWRRTRVTYRRIETVGSRRPRIERYSESETTQRTGPFGTPQTARRERSRTIVGADDLAPISARGEIAWWTGEEWRKADYDLRFDEDRVRGVIRDSAGRAEELDRAIPPGIILRELRNLAFATLAADALVGRSVEFVTFDPRTGEMGNERFDVRDAAEIEVAGREYEALRVNVASGLTNVTAYFRLGSPRILLRQESDEGGGTEEVIRLELYPSPERAEPD